MGTKGYIDVLDVDCGRSPVSIEAVEQRLVWTLPTDATCAKRARDLVDDTLTVLGVDREVIRDAKLMVSELATNSYRHAHEHPPHELWFDPGPREVVCAVFDALPMAFDGDTTFSADHGRGLSIVEELSGGRCGRRLTVSRFEPYAEGKAVWFAVQRG
jgi:two-component sensor histidine kinase